MTDKELIERQAPAATSELPSTPAPLTPVAPEQRINALDILRGIALIGILLMNIEWFSRPISDLGGFNTQLTGLDHSVGWLIRCFIEGKFYKLFALLFGMGFAVMLTQAMAKGRPFGAWFTRRMLVLYGIGLLHMVFVWQGDILHDYALAGLLMLGFIYILRIKRFRKYNNPRSILKLALWWLTIPLLLSSLAGIGYAVVFDRQALTEQWQESQDINALVKQLETQAELKRRLAIPEVGKVLDELEGQNPDIQIAENTKGGSEDTGVATIKGEEVEVTPQEQAQDIFAAKQDKISASKKETIALRDGSYWQATVFRTKAALKWMLFSPIFAVTLLLPLFLLGYWLVVSGAIKDHAQHPRLFGYMARIGLGVGLVVTVGSLLLLGHPAVESIMPIQAVGNVLFNGGQLFMAAGYLGLILRLLDAPKWHKLLAKLAPMGRMALTNYIMHSLILTSIFYGYAGGMYGDISRAPQMLLVLAIVVLQIILSSVWLKYFQFGPLEWLWRSLTYKKWQSFRVVH